MAPWLAPLELAGRTPEATVLHGRKPKRDRGMRRAYHSEMQRRRRLGSMGRGAADLGGSGEFCGSSLCALSESGSRRESEMRVVGVARALVHPKERSRRGGKHEGVGSDSCGSTIECPREKGTFAQGGG